ncbi:MAG: caspase family protein [Burkholderiaceae bacterium]
MIFNTIHLENIIILCLLTLYVNNGKYPKLGKLTYPEQDAQVMDEALTRLNFKTIVLRNGTQNEMRRALSQFTQQASGADLAFIYYSGHGAQSGGTNYLIPVGAQLDSESDYDIETLGLTNILDSVAKAAPKNAVLVLDACRDNPLAFRKSGTKGLARLPQYDRILIGQATTKDNTAPDNGLYAKVLAQQLSQANVTVVNAFLNTNEAVRKQSGGRQIPTISDITIEPSLVLNGASSIPAPALSAPLKDAAQQTLAPISIIDIEKEEWDAIKNKTESSPFLRFIARHPKSVYLNSATEKAGAITTTTNGCLFKNRAEAGTTVDWSGYCTNKLLNGEGVLIFKFSSGNSLLVKGQYSDGVPVGKFNFTYTYVTQTPGAVMTRELSYNSYGKISTQQKFTTANGFSYSGETDAGDAKHFGQPHGQGQMSTNAGAVYVGGFELGKRHGTGKLNFPDGSLYSGNYQSDMQEGFGTLEYPRNDAPNSVIRYVGMWKANKKHGQGTDFLKDGAKFVGEFKDGKANGFGRFYGPNGQLNYEAEFINGQRVSK